MSTTNEQPPRFAVDDPAERERFGHHIEWENGWEYKTTRVLEADHPNGWDHLATQPDGFELNVDRWPQYDEERVKVTRVAPGVLRNPSGPNGPVIIAYWRRKR